MKTAGTVSISVALRGIVVAVLGLVYMFLTSVLLTLLTIAILPVLLVALRIYSGLNKRYTQEGLSASAEASTVAEEVFGSIRTVCRLHHHSQHQCYVSDVLYTCARDLEAKEFVSVRQYGFRACVCRATCANEHLYD